MRFNLWYQGEVKRLPKPVQEYMRRKFLLPGEYVAGLRCFEYDAVIGERPVRCLRIFSPYLAQREHVSIRTNADLEQHPEVLIYEGTFDAQGNIYIEDRRTMSYPEKMASRRR